VSAEKRLIKRLLKNYDEVGVVGRPVINISETINVSYGIGLIQILDLDEKNQILSTNVWCRYVSTKLRPPFTYTFRFVHVGWGHRRNHPCQVSS